MKQISWENLEKDDICLSKWFSRIIV